MDFKIRGIELVKCPLTWQHTAFQPTDSAGISLLHWNYETYVPKDISPASQNPNTPLNVPKQAAADFVFSHRICGCSSFKQFTHCRDPPPSSESHHNSDEMEEQFRGNEARRNLLS